MFALVLPSLDADTLVFGAFAVSLMVMLLLAIFRARHRDTVGGLGLWLAGTVALTVGNLLFLFEQEVPTFVTVVGANGLVIAGMNLVAVGMYRFADRRAGPLLYASLALAVLKVAVLTTYVTAGVPGTRLRIVVLAGAVLVAAAAGLRGLPRAHRWTLPGTLFGSAAVAVVVVGLTRIAQGLFFLDAGGATSRLLATVFTSVYFVTLTAQFVSLALFVLQRLYEHEQALKRRIDLLYRELDHRVGNNLNVIYNMLDLARADLNETDEGWAVLAQSQNLVGTITAMHRVLDCHRNGAGTGSLDEYLATLVQQALESFTLTHLRLDLDLDLQPACVDAKTLRNCGLMVNEVVTNACKYAFRGREHGTITLRLEHTPAPLSDGTLGQRLCLMVADDGCGLPAPWGCGQAKGSGFGQTLVEQLAMDLEADFDVQTGPEGTRVTWTFLAPDPDAASQRARVPSPRSLA